MINPFNTARVVWTSAILFFIWTATATSQQPSTPAPTSGPPAGGTTPAPNPFAPAAAQSAASTAQPAASAAAAAPAAQPLKPEELEQVAAPIALYPDSLLAQVLMASTYPLEVVQADRWVKANPKVTGDALAAELNKQTWDASVKSLVNFPQVLAMMSDKLDWTIKLGDAFIADQKAVMDAVQKLRAKAKDNGNLQSNQEQTVTVEQAPPAAAPGQPAPPQTIVIQSAQPNVVYVPAYNPTVVYGTWPYPAYPPVYYPPPPGYSLAGAAISFGAGVALGAAWGHAWGNCNWHGGDVDIDVNRNTNFNRSIDRNTARTNIENRSRSTAGARSNSFQHDPSHRRGAPYRDAATNQRYRGSAAGQQTAQARNAYRGRAEAGRQDIARGGANAYRGGAAAGGPTANRASAGTYNRQAPAPRPQTTGTRSSGFSGAGSSAANTRAASARGQSSRSSSAYSRPSGSSRSSSYARPSSGGGGGARMGGGSRGGARGGGGRR